MNGEKSETASDYPYETHLNVLHPALEVIVPKGVMHRPRAPEKTVILMVEHAGIVPTGTAAT